MIHCVVVFGWLLTIGWAGVPSTLVLSTTFDLRPDSGLVAFSLCGKEAIELHRDVFVGNVVNGTCDLFEPCAGCILYIPPGAATRAWNTGFTIHCESVERGHLVCVLMKINRQGICGNHSRGLERGDRLTLNAVVCLASPDCFRCVVNVFDFGGEEKYRAIGVMHAEPNTERKRRYMPGQLLSTFWGWFTTVCASHEDFILGFLAGIIATLLWIYNHLHMVKQHRLGIFSPDMNIFPFPPEEGNFPIFAEDEDDEESVAEARRLEKERLKIIYGRLAGFGFFGQVQNGSDPKVELSEASTGPDYGLSGRPDGNDSFDFPPEERPEHQGLLAGGRLDPDGSVDPDPERRLTIVGESAEEYEEGGVSAVLMKEYYDQYSLVDLLRASRWGFKSVSEFDRFLRTVTAVKVDSGEVYEYGVGDERRVMDYFGFVKDLAVNTQRVVEYYGFVKDLVKVLGGIRLYSSPQKLGNFYMPVSKIFVPTFSVYMRFLSFFGSVWCFPIGSRLDRDVLFEILCLAREASNHKWMVGRCNKILEEYSNLPERCRDLRNIVVGQIQGTYRAVMLTRIGLSTGEAMPCNQTVDFIHGYYDSLRDKILEFLDAKVQVRDYALEEAYRQSFESSCGEIFRPFLALHDAIVDLRTLFLDSFGMQALGYGFSAIYQGGVVSRGGYGFPSYPYYADYVSLQVRRARLAASDYTDFAEEAIDMLFGVGNEDHEFSGWESDADDLETIY